MDCLTCSAYCFPRCRSFSTGCCKFFLAARADCFSACPFAGYHAQHTFNPSPLLPIQWSYAVQAYAPWRVRPLSDGRVPPASVHGLSSDRPGGDVVQQRRATQIVVHLPCRTHPTPSVYIVRRQWAVCPN